MRDAAGRYAFVFASARLKKIMAERIGSVRSTEVDFVVECQSKICVGRWK
jgi:hypothetical protein